MVSTEAKKCKFSSLVVIFTGNFEELGHEVYGLVKVDVITRVISFHLSFLLSFEI